MSSFSPATLEPHPLRKGWMFLSTAGGCLFEVGQGTGVLIHIPEGFASDGASGLPRWAWRLLPSGIRAQLALASMLHDRLRTDLRFSKIDGDCLFLIAMFATGVHPIVREVAFIGVRLNHSRNGAA